MLISGFVRASTLLQTNASIHMKPKNEPSTIQNRRFHVLSIAYSKDGDRKSINDFRAEEEKVEREYEKKQSEIEQNQTKENDQSTNTASDEESDKVRDIRCKILDAAIPFVVQHGWSREAITHGAESINYPGIAHGLFPKGSIELINHFYVKCNRETIERLRDEKIEDHTEFLVKALKTRIELVIPYRDTWPQAIAKLALPHNAATSLAQMLTFVDDVCYLTGQDSADVNNNYFAIHEMHSYDSTFVLFSDKLVCTSCRPCIRIEDIRSIHATR